MLFWIYIKSEKTQCTQCPGNKYSFDSKACIDPNPIPNCDNYENYNVNKLLCEICDDDYYLSSDKKTCTKCPSNQFSIGLSCLDKFANSESHGDTRDIAGCKSCKVENGKCFLFNYK
jgi:hypothetical protein